VVGAGGAFPDEARDEGEGRPPSEAERRFREGLARTRAGELEGAVAAYREALTLEPSHIRARNNLAVLLDRAGDHEGAAGHLRRALELDPENSELLSNLGAALGSLGRFDEAEKELKRAARLDPTRTDVRANLGILYLRRGLCEPAEVELRWVCERDRDHAAAHFYRGEALNCLGRVEEALRVLERAVQLQPGNSRAYQLMGILYDRKREPDMAAAMYRRAREVAGR
jgi:Flp pilus assembly protein TadD